MFLCLQNRKNKLYYNSQSLIRNYYEVTIMRKATVDRQTKETNIHIELDLDGGETNINTGIGFFDHMLTAFSVHGGFGLTVKTEGDLYVDCHHTVEDTGIVLGKVFDKALGDKGGIARFGTFYVPMDEALGFCSLDISGRPFLVFDAQFPEEKIGGYDSCMTEEFMRAFAYQSGITLHLKCLYGKNSHHITEALYKALGHALKAAVQPAESSKPLSTKGVL